MPSGYEFTSDGGFLPSGQTGGMNTEALVRAAAETAINVGAPILRDQIVPRILADRVALRTAASGVGEGIMREAGAVGRFAMFGIGALGTGVLLWGLSRLVAAGNR